MDYEAIIVHGFVDCGTYTRKLRESEMTLKLLDTVKGIRRRDKTRSTETYVKCERVDGARRKLNIFEMWGLLYFLFI